MKRSRAVVSIVLAGAVVVAGCGSSSTKASSTAGTSGTTAAAPTKSALVVGTVGCWSGPQSPASMGGQLAATAWPKWVNAHGGINGHPVTLYAEDDGCDQARSISAVKDLVENKHVLALVGISTPGGAASWASYVQAQKVAVIGGEAFVPPWITSPVFFPLSTTVPQILQAQVKAAQESGAKTFAVVHCSEQASCTGSDPIQKSAATQLGVQFAGAVAVSQAAPDYTAQCVALKDKGATWVQLAISSVAGQHVISDCARQGYAPIYGAAGPSWDENLRKAGETVKLQGIADAFPWFVDTPATHDFQSAMKQYANGTVSDTASMAWSALQLFGKVAAAFSDNPTRDDVFSGLYSLKGETLGGLLPQPVNFTSGQPSPQIKCFFTVGVQAGKFVAPNGLTPSCVS
jgi:branched-chain amino acid transport system substrate-binding protein